MPKAWVQLQIEACFRMMVSDLNPALLWRLKMQALVWTAPEKMEMQEYPDPMPAADEVVIRVAFAGICGSELSGFLGHNALRTPPLVMGHEFAGEIVEVGARGAPGSVVGDAVTVNPLTYCGQCRTCRMGLTQLCPERVLVGAHRPGGFCRIREHSRLL